MIKWLFVKQKVSKYHTQTYSSKRKSIMLHVKANGVNTYIKENVKKQY